MLTKLGLPVVLIEFSPLLPCDGMKEFFPVPSEAPSWLRAALPQAFPLGSQ